MSGFDLVGTEDLYKNLARLARGTEAKVWKAAASQAMTPVRLAAKLRAPVGTKAHKTYKGRWVAPGFTRRSVRKKTAIENGKVVVRVGVRKEAYYAVQFLEEGIGPVTERTYNRPRRAVSIRPYSIKGRHWLTPALTDNTGPVLNRFTTTLRRKVLQALK